jgi:uncharacterized protein (TIGR03086 family)
MNPQHAVQQSPQPSPHESPHESPRPSPQAGPHRGRQEDPAAQLEEALELAGRLVSGVKPDQWELPTPCTEWNVRQLVDHLVLGQQLFARVLRGEPFEQAFAAVRSVDDRLGDDPAGAYDVSAREVLAAFTAPGVLEQLVRVPFGTVPGAVAGHLRIIECLVHGWDLAIALGVPFDPPAGLVEQEIAFSGPLLGQVPPGRHVFAPSRAISDEAPPIERLAALLGRGPAGV